MDEGTKLQVTVLRNSRQYTWSYPWVQVLIQVADAPRPIERVAEEERRSHGRVPSDRVPLKWREVKKRLIQPTSFGDDDERSKGS